MSTVQSDFADFMMTESKKGIAAATKAKQEAPPA